MVKTSKDMTILERRYVPCGDIILHEGERGNNAYLVQSGEVEVYSMAGEREIILGKMGPGQIFGEMALVFDKPRTASVRATEHCNLIVITRNVFNDKLRRSDTTIRAIINMLTKRIIETNNALLNKNDGLDDLQETVLNVYNNVVETLPKTERREFRNAVLPELNNFLDAVARFSRELQLEKAADNSEDDFTL
ncbi:MAG: cyclic nucleotide-binding domain-containing protein [Alphaproteobacteria bacterium]